MFTILFVALFLGSGLIVIVVITSVGVWQRRAHATELQHCADRPEVTMSLSMLLVTIAPQHLDATFGMVTQP